MRILNSFVTSLPKTECLQLIIAGRGIKTARNMMMDGKKNAIIIHRYICIAFDNVHCAESPVTESAVCMCAVCILEYEHCNRVFERLGAIGLVLCLGLVFQCFFVYSLILVNVWLSVQVQMT